MNILIANVGSTSFKYKLIDMDAGTVLAEGKIDRVGEEDAGVVHKARGKKKVSRQINIGDYPAAIQEAMDLITDPAAGAIRKLSQIDAVGFKTVHAKGITDSVLINDQVLEAMDKYTMLVPAHNPPYIQAIKIFMDLVPELPLVGVFETGFHRTMPEYEKLYGVPYDWYERYNIQRYGFHGASHRYIAETVPGLLKKKSDALKIISCHLGGSSSVCAIQDGRSVATSMGFTAQGGLLQSSRSGDTDPFIMAYLHEKEGMSVKDIADAMSKNGGLKGISGISGDCRDLQEEEARGSRRAKLALDSYVHGVKKYIGSYLAVLGGADALVFTGGIGENSDTLRARICDKGMQALGIKLDPKKNGTAGITGTISTGTSKINVMVVPTNEEIIVARESIRVLKREGLA